ncbi:unnamed protein product [Blepharisma stoltei]|uniref:Protein kinase domain-containing protein n=1 Tax=Blepharisma stoltei TaxID=1481888 RepID=A0AAU9IYT4_9CILI|nr:unnamed protein product [Blepharisma stoltei]
MEPQLNIQGRAFKLEQQLSNEEFVAQDKNSGLRYLLKYIKSPSPQRIKLLKNEIRILRELNPHPNIITLHSAKESEGSYLFLYEHCEGGSLQNKTVQDPLKALYQISLALQHMHQRSIPIIHRNITPYNILCQGDEYKVTGMESASEQYTSLTDLDLFNRDTELLQISDLKWRAPELIDPNPHYIIDNKTDIWGLGMVFYYILFGISPFPDLKSQQEGVWTTPREVSWKIRELLQVMLNPNPLKRADIYSVLTKLDEHNPNQDSHSCATSCFPKISPFSRLKSKKSTQGLIQNACSNNSLPLKEIFSKKLVAKVWAKPKKINKFYAEMLRLQGLDNPQVRLKALTLLLIYLQEGPLYVYQNTPGAVEVLHYIESYCSVRPGHPLKSDFFRRVTNSFAAAIKQKYYVTKSNIGSFNGRFVINHENGQFNCQVDMLLIDDLLFYWQSLIKIHEMLATGSHLEAICKSIRILLINEQQRLLEIISPCIKKLSLSSQNNDLSREFNKAYFKAKTLFEIDNTEIPLNPIPTSEIPEILIDDPIYESSKNNNNVPIGEIHRQSQNSPSSSSSSSESSDDDFQLDQQPLPRFSSVQLQPAIIETHYSTARCEHLTTVHDYDLIDLSQDRIEKFTNHLNEQYNSWIIDIKNVRCMRQIGNGSSSEVWLGLYQKTFVAVKKLKHTEKQSIKEFGREVSLLIKLRHPNLVLFMGAYIGEDQLCVLTEYCQGGDLFQLLHKRKDIFISWEQKLKICHDVAVGMNYLHSNNYIHRDLKSLNLLLASPLLRPTDSVTVKISDFGLSKEFKFNGFMTGQLGTCHWMAPEVLSSSDYSLKADIYSYAIVMYEIITREIPYKGLSHDTIKEKVLGQHQRPDMSLIPPSCPKALEKLMAMCWRSDPNKRPHFSVIVDMLNSIELPKSQ